jgi:Metallo-peptidase family M12/Secretion system C-terminal sorting domain/Fibronectin type III domain
MKMNSKGNAIHSLLASWRMNCTKRMTLKISVIAMVLLSSFVGLAQNIKPLAKMVHAQMDNGNTTTSHLFTPVSASQNQAFLNAKVISKGTVVKLDFTALTQLVESNAPVLSLELPFEGENLIVDMVQAPNVTDDFVVKTSTSSDKPVSYEKGRYYRGIIRGMDESVAAISFFKNEVIGVVSSSLHQNLNIGRLESSTARKDDYIIYSDKNFLVKPSLDCQSENVALKGNGNTLSDKIETAAMTVGGCVRVYYELDYGTFTNRGSRANAVNYITACFNSVATLYLNESISTVISEIFVWETPDSYPTDASGGLSAIRTTRTTFNGDLAHLVSLRTGSGFSGVAYLFTSSPYTVLCSAYKYAYSQTAATFSTYPTFSWTIEVLTHEMGHNMGSPHTQSCSWPGGAIDGCVAVEDGSCTRPALGAAGSGTIMSYCHLEPLVGINFVNGFGPLPGARVRTAITLVSCLAATCATATCDAPATPSVSSITSSGGTVSWAAITGAVSYKVEYKLSSSATWLTANAAVATTSYALTGLAAGSTYNVQVSTNCSGASSTASPSATFTTSTAATCAAPSLPTISSIAAGGAAVSWGAVAGAVTYKVEYKLSSAAAWTTANAAVVGTNLSLSGLSASTVYNVQVTTNCTGLISSPSGTLTFTTAAAAACNAPAIVNILSPTASGATLSWGFVSGAVSYKVEYKLASATLWIVSTSAAFGTVYNLSGLSAGMSYNVRVSTNCSGSTSAPSSITTFSTTGGATCAAPVTPSISSITTSGGLVSWSAVSGAVTYKVEYKLSSAVSWTTAISAVAGTSYTLSGLSAGTVYNVRVSTNCAALSSVPSGEATFTTTAAATCAAPATPSVSSIITSGGLVSWSAVSGAVSYLIEYKLSSAASWTTANATVFGTSYTLSGLSAGTVYNVRVSTNCAALSSVPSGEATFTTTAAATCAAPATPSVSSITTSGGLVSWLAVSGAVSYLIEYKLSSAASWTTANATVFGTSYTLSGLSAGTVYNVRVSTNCAALSSVPSGEATFTTTAVATCAAPATPSVSSITTSGGLVSWVSVSGAVSYKVEYKLSSSASWTTASTAVFGTSYTLSGLSAGTVYNVRVSTNCAALTSVPSAEATFTTASIGTCAAPATPSILATTANSASISWGFVSGAVSYKIEYKIQSAVSWTLASSAAFGTFYNLSGLSAGTTYNIRISTNCAAGTSVPSGAATFSTTGSLCSDANEPNNTQAASKVVSPNSITSGSIGNATDEDFYSITTTAAAPHIAIHLTQLDANIELELYSTASVLIGSSYRTGSNNEYITFSASGAATFFIRVIGNGGAISTNCYQLTVITDNTPFTCPSLPISSGQSNSTSDAPKTLDNATYDKMKLFVFPNPTTSNTNVRILALEGGEYDMVVYDIVGKRIQSDKLKLNEGENMHKLTTQSFNKGTYLIRVFNNNQSVVQKLVIE